MSKVDGRGKHGRHVSGEKHHRWNGGASITSHGYLRIQVGRAHPLADPNGYAYAHVMVWISAGNPAPGEGMVIHHINGVKLDNRIENLRLLTNAAHGHEHHGHIVETPELDGHVWAEVPNA